MKSILKICLIPKVIISTLALILLFITPCYGLDATLKWDANTERGFDHYEVFYRLEGQSYDYENPAWQGTLTDYTFVGPDDDTIYYFVVRAVGSIDDKKVQSANSREVCLLAPNSLAPYDRGWAITEGDLKGFAVLYVLYNDQVNADDDTPTLGPSSDIPALHDAFPNIIGVGAPLNLQPSPTTEFYSPVKISLPCPGYSDVSGLDIYYHNGTNWVLANDADDPGTVLPDAAGWMVPGSRVNHSGGTPSTIEIRVYHFSGVQAGVSSSSPASASSGGGGGGGGGGCFVATAAFGGKQKLTADSSKLKEKARICRRHTQTDPDKTDIIILGTGCRWRHTKSQQLFIKMTKMNQVHQYKERLGIQWVAPVGENKVAIFTSKGSPFAPIPPHWGVQPCGDP